MYNTISGGYHRVMSCSSDHTCSKFTYDELVFAIDKINDALKKKYHQTGMFVALSITKCVSHISVDVSIDNVSLELYCSDYDLTDRIYYEKSDTEETAYKFLKRRFRELKEEIYSVKI